MSVDVASQAAAPPRRKLLHGRIDRVRDYGIVASFAALFVTLCLASEPFLTKVNLLNILDQWSAPGLIAVAGTIVFIAGGFDISVGAVFALSGVIAAKLTESMGVEAALLIGVAVGAGCGLLNALLVTLGRINAFIATLATSIMLGGVATLITNGELIVVQNEAFARLGNTTFLGMQWSIWILISFSAICGLTLARTTLGRAVYATGGNPEAARLSGIRIGMVRSFTYVLSGTAAGIAGVIVASRVSTGQADVGGIDLAFDAVAGIVIGGTSILGGAGAVWRTLLGILLLAMIGNGFDLIGVDPLYQQVLKGAIILAAVAVDAWARKER